LPFCAADCRNGSLPLVRRKRSIFPLFFVVVLLRSSSFAAGLAGPFHSAADLKTFSFLLLVEASDGLAFLLSIGLVAWRDKTS